MASPLGQAKQKWPTLKDGKFTTDKSQHSDASEEKKKVRRGIDPDAPVAEQRQGKDSAPQASSGCQSSGVGPAFGPFRDEELRCPICLEIMYKPVGLGCGHKFCRSCALEAAGFGKVFGAFRNIISYIPSRTPCPQCRQKQVYKGAVSLKELALLIKERYPREWAERKSQEKEERAKLNLPVVEGPSTNHPFELLRPISSTDLRM